MLNEAHIVVDNCPRSVHHAPQIADVLPHNGCHLVQLLELVPVVLSEHAAGTYQLLAVTAEILDRLVGMLRAEDLADGSDAGLRRPHRMWLLNGPV